jgi:hypothetical protein
MEEPGEELVDTAVARVAAIETAKTSALVCTRVPHDAIEGRRVQQVWSVAATNAILELGDRLVGQGVQRVVMEATGTFGNIPDRAGRKALGREVRRKTCASAYCSQGSVRCGARCVVIGPGVVDAALA